VRNENMVDFGKFRFGLPQLNLCSFATIDQKVPVGNFQKLRGRGGFFFRDGRVEAQYG